MFYTSFASKKAHRKVLKKCLKTLEKRARLLEIAQGCDDQEESSLLKLHRLKQTRMHANANNGTLESKSSATTYEDDLQSVSTISGSGIDFFRKFVKKQKQRNRDGSFRAGQFLTVVGMLLRLELKILNHDDISSYHASESLP